MMDLIGEIIWRIVVGWGSGGHGGDRIISSGTWYIDIDLQSDFGEILVVIDEESVVYLILRSDSL